MTNPSSHNSPIFQPIFGDQWDALPTVMKKHYANRPYSNDVVRVDGRLNVDFSGPMRLLAPIFWLTRVLIPYRGNDVPVTVNFRSYPDSNIYSFDRVFYFPGKKPYRFQSYMVPGKNNEIYERMRFGIAWHMNYLWDGEKVVLKHKGYVWRVFGWNIPLPLKWIFGEGYAHEIALSDDEFEMNMEITHPWFGKVYTYNGYFKVVDADEK